MSQSSVLKVAMWSPIFSCLTIKLCPYLAISSEILLFLFICISKQTAVDAARLLLGISQIQNLRQKSECLNLDTSVASSTLDFKRTSISGTDHATSESMILQEVPATLI